MWLMSLIVTDVFHWFSLGTLFLVTPMTTTDGPSVQRTTKIGTWKTELESPWEPPDDYYSSYFIVVFEKKSGGLGPRSWTLKNRMICAPSFIHFSTLSPFLRFHQMWAIKVGLRFEKCLKEFQLPCGIFLYRNTLIWVLHLHSISPFMSFLALHFALHLHSIFLLLFMT